MRINVLLFFLVVSLSLSSCSIYYNAFIRNTSNGTATIDVYLLNKEDLQFLPNKVKVANKVVAFKSGYRKHVDNWQNVDWIDTNHFKLNLSPNTTVDLTDMAGKVLNGSFRQEVLVTVTVANRTDTIVNASGQSYRGMFQYKSMGFGAPIIYHDIR